MAAKTQNRAKRQQRRPADADKRKGQAAMAAEKRMKTRGKTSKARLAELTAELDTRMADVQGLYTTVRRTQPPAAKLALFVHRLRRPGQTPQRR